MPWGRIADPWRMADRADAYDLDKRDSLGPDQTPVLPGPWFHGSDRELPIGTILEPNHEPSKWNYNPTSSRYHPAGSPRKDWVFMSQHPGAARFWAPHVHRVEPLDEGPYSYNDELGQGYVSPRAKVVEYIPGNEDRMQEYAERMGIGDRVGSVSSLAPRRVAAAEHNGAMVALYPRADDAYKMAVANGEPVEELHLTLVFLGDDASELAPPDHLHLSIARLADAYTVIDAPVIGRAIFDEGAVVYLIGENPQLPDLQTDVLNECHAEYSVPREKHPFRPHVTIGYDITPRQLRFEGTVIFDRIGVAFGGKTKYFPLMGATVPEYSD